MAITNQQEQVDLRPLADLKLTLHLFDGRDVIGLDELGPGVTVEMSGLKSLSLRQSV